MPKRSQKIIFAGTPEFAAIHLKALIESEHQLIGVYTQPDRPAGRGKKVQASPVKRLATDAGLVVYQPDSLRDVTAQQHLASLGADILVVVAYGLILPPAVLDAPRLGAINVHASLLPRWRGAAPVQRAIEAGDERSGITIMQMDEGLDTGDILATAACPIEADATADSLLHELAQAGPPLLLEVLRNVPAYQSKARQQEGGDTTYAKKIQKSEAEICWAADAQQIERSIRAFNPFPVAFTLLQGDRLKVWQAHVQQPHGDAGTPGTIIRADGDGIVVACGEGSLNIQTLQLPGGRALTAAQLLNAHSARFAPGAQFLSPAGHAGA